MVIPMKMTELRAENESLKQQLQLLSQQNEGTSDSAETTQLKEKNRSLRKSVKDLKAENKLLSGKIQALETDKSSREQEHQLLKAELERIQQQFYELSDIHARTSTELDSLNVYQKALLKKTGELPILQAELERLRQVENICSEKTAQVVALQAELEQRNRLLEELRSQASTELAEHQGQVAKLSGEMETLRNQLLAELETQRQQSGAAIASLQSEKDSLTAKTIDLTEKLKLVATHLEKQLNEKKKIASQYDASVKEFQNFKEKSDKQIKDLMALMQKMAAELDASRAAHPAPDPQAGTATGDKPAGLVNASGVIKPPQLSLLDLQDRLVELDLLNASQARELAALSSRMKRIDHALATPFGRIFSELSGIKGSPK